MPSSIPFYKYHALGNDYIVMNPKEIGISLSVSQIQWICHRNYGIGSDGILLGPIERSKHDLALRIYNPDGSEAEKSGNGLRIFARYLWDKDFIQDDPVQIQTAPAAAAPSARAGDERDQLLGAVGRAAHAAQAHLVAATGSPGAAEGRATASPVAVAAAADR